MSPQETIRTILFGCYDSLEKSVQRRLGDDLDSVRQRIQNEIKNSARHDDEVLEESDVVLFVILYTILLEINDRKIGLDKRISANNEIWDFLIETGAKFEKSVRDKVRCKTNSNRVFTSDRADDGEIDVPTKMKEAGTYHECSNGPHVDDILESFYTGDNFDEIVSMIHPDLTASLYAEVSDPEGPSVDEKTEELRQILRSMIATGDVMLAEAEALDPTTPESGVSDEELVQAAELGYKQATEKYET